MTQEEILEDNKLIAEFMGEKCGEMTIQNKKGTWDFTEYHTSWDWLMTVVEKIESLNIRNNGYDFPKVKFLGDCVEIFTYATYRGTTFYWKGYMGLDGKCYNYFSNQKNSKIEAVWYAVVEFIKWYNQWKKEK